MEYRDYYKILDIERDATQDQIKKAYRKLVRKYHPDVNTGPDAAEVEQKFKDVGEAYEVLQDPEKRAAYDRLGKTWQEGEAFRPPPDWDDGFEFSGGGYTQADPDQFGAFFDELFSRRGGFDQTAGPRPAFHASGQDHHARITIDLQEAYDGGSRDFTLRKPELDPQGHVVLRERAIRVTIPKGVSDGQHIRLSGQGAPGLGQGKPGDLFLEVTIRDKPGFHVEGRDVHMDVPITPWEAALGARVDMRTPAGKVQLTIPKHTQTGKKLRLKARGIPGKSPGNLIAVLKIVVPPTETEKARELYREMAREADFDPRVTMEG
ncbi:MAG TPA: cytochrome C biogenesis protein [Rhodobacteraceae bacterium]|nr:cytochrome C biogenesis protein [Paracoccaceae bacterium]